MSDCYDSKNIYLIKGQEIIGLHSIGIDNDYYTIIELDGTETKHFGFNPSESWGNVYNWNFEIQGRGSFHCSYFIDDEANAYKDDGYVEFSRFPK